MNCKLKTLIISASFIALGMPRTAKAIASFGDRPKNQIDIRLSSIRSENEKVFLKLVINQAKQSNADVRIEDGFGNILNVLTLTQKTKEVILQVNADEVSILNVQASNLEGTSKKKFEINHKFVQTIEVNEVK